MYKNTLNLFVKPIDLRIALFLFTDVLKQNQDQTAQLEGDGGEKDTSDLPLAISSMARGSSHIGLSTISVIKASGVTPR